MPPGTPGGRRRPKNDAYVPYNDRPKEVGTRTGKPMPQNVRINEEGFEDPDDFFKSPDTSRRVSGRASFSQRRGKGNGSSPRSPAMNVRTKRMSDLIIEEEEASDAFEAEDLLVDDDELDRRTPPGPLNPSSPNPPPSVTVDRRGFMSSPVVDMSPSFRRRRSPSGRQTPASRSERQRAEGSSSVRRPVLHSPVTLHDGPHESQIPDISAEFDAAAGDFGGGEDYVNGHLEEAHADEPMEIDDSQPARRRGSTARKYVGRLHVEEEASGVPDTFSGDENGNDDGGDVYMNHDDYDAQEPASDDDADLERQAVDDENGYSEQDPEEDEGIEMLEEQNLANIEKTRLAKRSPTRKAKQRAEDPVPKTTKRSRVSQLPLEGETGYMGDFTTRRSGRRHFRPLAWWRGERFEYARGPTAPIVEAVVHVPPPQPIPRVNNRRAGRRGRAASSARSRGGTVEEPERDLDENTPTNHLILEYPSGQEVKRRVAMPRSKLELKAVLAGNFMYQKAFGEDKFIASGHLYLPPQGGKPSKSSRDNSYVFYVIEGAVKVTIHKSHFVVSTGGSFIVPRGNVYQIANILETETKLFFAQSRKILASEEEEVAMAEITGAGIQSMGAQRGEGSGSEEGSGSGSESDDGVIYERRRGVAA